MTDGLPTTIESALAPSDLIFSTADSRRPLSFSKAAARVLPWPKTSTCTRRIVGVNLTAPPPLLDTVAPLSSSASAAPQQSRLAATRIQLLAKRPWNMASASLLVYLQMTGRECLSSCVLLRVQRVSAVSFLPLSFPHPRPPKRRSRAAKLRMAS